MAQDPRWAGAIADLERRLEAAREQVERLELILEICRDRMEREASLSPEALEREDSAPESH